MAKPKTEHTRGGRGGGHRGGHRQQQSNRTRRMEQEEGVVPRNQRYDQHQTKYGHHTRHEDSRRGRVKKVAQVVDNHPSSGIAQSVLNPFHQASTARGTLSTHNPFCNGSRRSRAARHSTVTCISTLSTRAGATPCDKCIHVNRRLRDYLLNLLESSRRAVDEWAAAAHVSLEAMDWERTKTRTIPNGLRRGSEPCNICCAELREAVWDRGDGAGGLMAPKVAGAGGGFFERHPPALMPSYQQPMPVPEHAPAAYARWGDYNDHMLQAYSHPYQQQQQQQQQQRQQHPNGGRITHSMSLDPNAPAQEPEVRNPFAAAQHRPGGPPRRLVLTPPSSGEMTIPHILNHPMEGEHSCNAQASIDMTTLCEVMRDGVQM